MNRELNSQIGIRSQDSHFSESDGAPLRDANDSLCTTWFAIAARCGTTALAVTAQMKSSSLVLVN